VRNPRSCRPLDTWEQVRWLPSASGSLQRLQELGWIEGRKLAIEFRWAEGRNERFAEFSGEFVRLDVDVIVASGAGAVAAKKATYVTPIVFPVAPDPIGAGLVTSLARPMGNVTGLSTMNADLAGKRLELMRELVPGMRRVAILVNVGYPSAIDEMGQVQAAASQLGLDTDRCDIRRSEDVESSFETLKGGVQALCRRSLVNTNRVRIARLALGARRPTKRRPTGSVLHSMFLVGPMRRKEPARRRPLCHGRVRQREDKLCAPPRGDGGALRALPQRAAIGPSCPMETVAPAGRLLMRGSRQSDSPERILPPCGAR
jgi:hypothetical protein